MDIGEKKYFILLVRHPEDFVLSSPKSMYRSLLLGGCPAKSPLQKYGAYDLPNADPPIPWLETAPLGPTKPVKVEASRPDAFPFIILAPEPSSRRILLLTATHGAGLES